MIRKMADNDDELFTADCDLDLDDFVDVIKDGQVMDRIWDCMTDDDRAGAWDWFLDALKEDFSDFYMETDFNSAMEDMKEDLSLGTRTPYDISQELWYMVEDYVADKLMDDFINTEASDDEEIYQKTGGDFLDKLYGIFKGKHITVHISAEAGEIK